jgi:hypothetical protein
VFTVEQRNALLERALELADGDERVTAGAIVGSLGADAGDQYSDVDLTFAVADDVELAVVLDEWTRALADGFGAVRLADLRRGPTTYRVFLLADALQLDLSMTPAAEFRPVGPRFRLLFGETSGEPDVPSQQPATGDLFIATPVLARDIFGWGVIYALHARACIERRRPWQAEHYIGAVRDHALSLACLLHDRAPAQARGYDDLPASVLAAFEHAHVSSLDDSSLRTALGASVSALLDEGRRARLPHAQVTAERLTELVRI